MSISTGPVPHAPPKKRGLGCLGCGCGGLALLVILALGLVGGIAYMGYRSVLQLTSTTPATIPVFDGGDDLYQKVRHKLGDFNHDVINHQAATVRLSADEVNTLIAHEPTVAANHVQAFVAFTGGEGHLQATFPTDRVSHGWISNRYASIDLTFDVHYDPVAKGVAMTPHTLAVADRPIIGADAPADQSAQTVMHSFLPGFNQKLNASLRKNADCAALLDQAKTIEIRDGQLVVETQ